MFTLLVTTALAADRVLDLDGDADLEAVAKVADLDAPPQPVRVTDLSQRPASITGGGQLTWCTGAPTDLDGLATAMANAEGAMAYMEYEAAAKTLGEALSSLQCLADPVDPTVAARLFYLRGVVAHRSGFSEEASKAFGIALVFAPDLAWDDAFPPKALDLFDQARQTAAGLETVAVTLQPAGTVVLDGRPATTLDLVPGTHLIQVDGQTASLEIYPGTAPTLTLPALFDGVEDIQDPAAQAELTLLAGEDRILVVQDGRVWGPVDGAYQDLGRLPRTKATPEQAPAEAESAEEPPREPSAGGPRWLLPGGGALALGGAAVGTAALLATRSAATTARSSTTWEAYQQSLGAAQTRSRVAQVGYGVAIIGGVGAVAGLVLTQDRGWSLVPTPGGLLLTVVR